MCGVMSEFGGIPTGDPDPPADAEVADGVSEELSSTLGAIKQDELDLGPIESDDQAGDSPATAQVAPALTRCRIGGAAVRPGMPNMSLELAGSEVTPSLSTL